MSTKIITDNSCDLSKELLNQYNIKTIGLIVSIDGIHYNDLDLKHENFYKKMKESKDLPKTACPSPNTFAQEYGCEEDNIIVFTLTSKLSGIYSAALLGKDMFLEDNSKNIVVIDTECGTVGHGLIILKTAKLIKEGKLSFREILSEIEIMKTNIKTYGALDTLDNAIKGGRISSVKGKIANALNLKGLITVEDGIVKPIGTTRGEINSFKKITDYIVDCSKDKNTKDLVINIGHANSPKKAEKVKELILSKLDCKEIIISSIGPTIGTYTAEGAVIISVL